METAGLEENVGVVCHLGNWRLLPEEECVISMVARDGIEPPTPAFSGLPGQERAGIMRAFQDALEHMDMGRNS